VKTKRAHSSDLANGKFVPPLELTTNEISFDVRPMSETEEAAEAARIGAALDASKDRLEQIRLADQLSYLAGDAAVPEKIKLFGFTVVNRNRKHSVQVIDKLFPILRKKLENDFCITG